MITEKETEVISLARKALDDRGVTHGDVISVRPAKPKDMSLRQYGWVVGFKYELPDTPPGAVMDPAYFYVEVYEDRSVLIPPIL